MKERKFSHFNSFNIKNNYKMASSLGRTKPEVYIVTNQYKMGNVKECPWGIKMIKIETLY